MQSTLFLKLTSYGDRGYVFKKLESVMSLICNKTVVYACSVCVSLFILYLYCGTIVMYYVNVGIIL